ncbi:hypothetical protein PENSPDRAFT_671532 [Peniophora sp. CONT]|nr:hypothetical protein PENSPDRAFT_671532 [Peniophora sp. CONT]
MTAPIPATLPAMAEDLPDGTVIGATVMRTLMPKFIIFSHRQSFAVYRRFLTAASGVSPADGEACAAELVMGAWPRCVASLATNMTDTAPVPTTAQASGLPVPAGEQHSPDQRLARLSRLRALAWSREGCRALFDGEAEIQQELDRMRQAIIMHGWMVALEQGEDLGEPEDAAEQEALEKARRLLHTTRIAHMMRLRGPRYAVRDPDAYLDVFRRFIAWAERDSAGVPDAAV